jgi:hypothetical protein
MHDGAPLGACSSPDIEGPAGPRAAAPSPRRSFKVLVRERGGSQGGRVIDVQLQVRRTGALVWAQTFSDPALARELEEQLERDLDELDEVAFRRAHRVTSDL